MQTRYCVVIGGGAAGFFAAIAAAEADRNLRVTLLEKGARFLDKVRISGGGRCNVTHACFDPRELASRYPRGAKALIGPFHRFGPHETIEWFRARGVKLKTEPDGRMFPVTDSSRTVMGCLMDAARQAGVTLRSGCGVTEARRTADDRFSLTLPTGEQTLCDRLLLATGGSRSPAAAHLATALGHRLEPPVPSLFAFQVRAPWLSQLAGISLEQVEASIPGTRLRQKGALVITHSGVSGPAILLLSAWGARLLNERSYHFSLQLDWLPQSNSSELTAELNSRRQSQGQRCVINTPLAPLPARLWHQLVLHAGIDPGTRWAALKREAQRRLETRLSHTELDVTGKSLNRDEFVTCGGVPLSEVNFKTMESRVCPGLHLAGELLDIDGITGGYNFQAAWTTGWTAGNGMAG